MKHIVTFAMLFTALCALSFAQPASKNEQTLTGTVTCSARLTGQYACHKGQTLQACTLACVDQGFKYELLVGTNTAYSLEGDKAQLEKFAGGQAVITGIVLPSENKIAVRSVSKVEKSPQSDMLTAGN